MAIRKRRMDKESAEPAEALAAPDAPEQTYKLKPVVEPRPSATSMWTRIQHPFTLGFLLVLGGLTAFVFGVAVSRLSTVLIYIVLALFIALGLDPAVRMLERRGLSRPVSILIAIAGLVVLIALVIVAIVPTVIRQVSSFVQGVPDTIRDFLASDLYALLYEQFGEHLESLIADIQAFLTNPNNIAAITGGAFQVGVSIVTAISGAIIVLVLTLYFVATLPAMKQSLLRFAPARDRENVATITNQITDSVGGYVMGMVVLAFLNAVVVFFLHLFLGLPFPLLMATFAFMITLIPLVGSLIFWVIGSGLALLTSPLMALIFAIAYLIYMQVEAYLLTPKVMNRTIAIPGALVVIGALVGGTLLGLLGALVAIPVTASLLIIIKQVWFARQDART